MRILIHMYIGSIESITFNLLVSVLWRIKWEVMVGKKTCMMNKKEKKVFYIECEGTKKAKLCIWINTLITERHVCTRYMEKHPAASMATVYFQSTLFKINARTVETKAFPAAYIDMFYNETSCCALQTQTFDQTRCSKGFCTDLNSIISHWQHVSATYPPITQFVYCCVDDGICHPPLVWVLKEASWTVRKKEQKRV